MYRRWVSAYQFKWTPILTYTRRHIELLRWLEEHTEPVAFSETDMRRFGVALVSRDLRVTVDPSGMNVQAGLSGVSTDRLLPAIEGILEVMEPRDTILTNATVASSVTLDGADYHEECARFAVRASDVSQSAADYRPIDASVLMDLESTDWTAQAEWGIVSSTELFTRLSDPTIGRLRRSKMPGGREQTSNNPGILAEELPPVSVFTDIYLARRHGGEVADLSDVQTVIGIANSQAETITNALAEQYLGETGGMQNELNTGA